MAGNRLAKGYRFVMYVNSVRYKKEIEKGGRRSHIFILELIDSGQNYYKVELPYPINSASEFAQGTSICFEVEFQQGYTDEIKLSPVLGGEQIYGIAPGSSPNANNSINKTVSQQVPPSIIDVPRGTIPQKIEGCDNSVLAMTLATQILCAQITSGQITINHWQDLTGPLFENAQAINNQLCYMQNNS